VTKVLASSTTKQAKKQKQKTLDKIGRFFQTLNVYDRVTPL